VFESVCGVIERRLKLKVNREKSSIRHAADATLLGFGFYFDGPQVRIRVAPKAIKQLKSQPRALTRRSWRVSMEFRIDKLNRFITGWMAYSPARGLRRMFRDLDGWPRRRLRQVRWKEWKSTAAKRHNLRIRGISESSARKWTGSSKGYLRVAGSKVRQVSLPNAYWNRLGLKTLSQTWQRLNPTARRTAGCAPACPVVWEGRADLAPYPIPGDLGGPWGQEERSGPGPAPGQARGARAPPWRAAAVPGRH
jgi:RNA-directed DNA polymerase